MDESIPSLLFWRRASLGLSQAKVAAIAGTTQSAMSRLERGTLDARISTLTETARALGLDLRLIPREILPRIDELLLTLQREGPQRGSIDEEPLYTLRDDEGDDATGE